MAAGRPVRGDVNGVLLFDKHAGLSSNGCLGIVKRLFAARKAGHTGTLDPFATGLLPVALGEATKFSQGLMDADKTYRATMRLGVTTTTGDTEGEVVATAPVNVEAEALDCALARFRGPIKQVPPMYSALKRDGKPLYAYARAGLVVEREARPVIILALDLLGRDGPMVEFRVRCSKGTYVRTLAEDIGAMLGCGAHLTALRREAVGDLTLQQAISAEALEALTPCQRLACLLPVDSLVARMPRLSLDPARAARLRLGQSVAIESGTLPDVPAMRIYDEGGCFLGMAGAENNVLRPLRLTASGPAVSGLPEQ